MTDVPNIPNPASLRAGRYFMFKMIPDARKLLAGHPQERCF